MTLGDASLCGSSGIRRNSYPEAAGQFEKVWTAHVVQCNFRHRTTGGGQDHSD